jgi:S-adenosylmethionine:diacylglycerol 3-amino-3-carboxypropyl transferase
MSKLNWKNYSRYARDYEKEVWCSRDKHYVRIDQAWITRHPVTRVWCTECIAESEASVADRKVVTQAKKAMKENNQQSLFNEEGK